MRGLPSILSLFRNAFNKFINTRARMLYSIYHMTLKILNNHNYGVKTSRFWHILFNIIVDVVILSTICKPLVVYRFYYMASFHSQTRRHVIKDLT